MAKKKSIKDPQTVSDITGPAALVLLVFTSGRCTPVILECHTPYSHLIIFNICTKHLQLALRRND